MAVRKSSVKKSALSPRLEKKTITVSFPTRFSQQQILYSLLLVAVFLVGYLFATVQATKGTTQKVEGVQTGATGAQPTPVAIAPAKSYTVGVGHLPVKGQDSAKVTFIEFADFRCPFCERFFTQAEQQLLKDYVDKGKVKLTFRHYAFLGPASVVAANAAECANDQGKFWDMHDYFYKNQPAETDTSMYNTETLTTAAGTLGLNSDQFRSCLDAKQDQKNVDTDLSDGQKVNVNGTPAFFINGQIIVGALPYQSFKDAIDCSLTGGKFGVDPAGATVKCFKS